MLFQSRVLLASASRTVTGEGETVKTYEDSPRAPINEGAKVYLDTTAVSASDTLDVTIVATVNGIDYVIGTFTQVATVSKQVITIASCPQSVKAVFVIAGSATDFTFQVDITR